MVLPRSHLIESQTIHVRHKRQPDVHWELMTFFFTISHKRQEILPFELGRLVTSEVVGMGKLLLE